MIDEDKSNEIDKGFKQWFKDREYNCIQWSDGKYLKNELKNFDYYAHLNDNCELLLMQKMYSAQHRLMSFEEGAKMTLQ